MPMKAGCFATAVFFCLFLAFAAACELKKRSVVSPAQLQTIPVA